MDYRQRIKDLREDADLSQEAFAEIIGLSRPQYTRYETGTNEMPIKYLIKICKYYDISADYVLGFTNTPNKLPKR